MVETWLAPVDVSGVTGINHCAFATKGSEVHLVYRDGSNLQYRKSVDEGSTWTTAVTIGSTEEIPLTKAIAVDGNFVHVVYCRDVKNGSAPPKIYYRRSIDGGTTWDSEVTLDNGAGVANNRFIRVSLAAEAGIVHLFWCSQDGTTFVADVLSYRRSVDNGTTWSTETTIGNATGAQRPEAAISGSVIHLVWTDTRDGTSSNGGETYYMRSLDKGLTWGSEASMSSSANHRTLRPTIAAYGNIAVMAWQDPGGTLGSEDIYWRYSSDGGASWSSTATLVSNTAEQEHASLIATKGLVAVCWTDRNDSPDATYAKVSRDGGATWASAQKLYTPTSDTAAPTIALSSRFLMVLDRPTSEALQLVRSPVFEADPGTTLLDDFNRADDASPPPGPDWTNGVTTFTGGEGLAIVSNQACHSGAGSYRQGCYWNRGQYANVDLVLEVSAWTASAGDGFTAYARLGSIGSGTTNGYALDVGHNGTNVDFSIWRTTAGSATTLKTLTMTIASGDKFALTCRGNLLIAWYRAAAATEWTQLLAVIDNTYKSGFVGLECLNGQNTKITNLWATPIVSYPTIESHVQYPKPKLQALVGR